MLRDQYKQLIIIPAIIVEDIDFFESIIYHALVSLEIFHFISLTPPHWKFHHKISSIFGIPPLEFSLISSTTSTDFSGKAHWEQIIKLYEKLDKMNTIHTFSLNVYRLSWIYDICCWLGGAEELAEMKKWFVEPPWLLWHEVS